MQVGASSYEENRVHVKPSFGKNSVLIRCTGMERNMCLICCESRVELLDFFWERNHGFFLLDVILSLRKTVFLCYHFGKKECLAWCCEFCIVWCPSLHVCLPFGAFPT